MQGRPFPVRASTGWICRFNPDEKVMVEMQRARSLYLRAAVIVWVAILLATSVLLREAPEFPAMLTILGGGAAFFVVILPASVFRDR